ncbi:MAG: HipA domain-containing protein, partial [Bacteroidia bacterium]|nr:HipA domain-containing protein [Bacteroidia bacterium]
GVNYKYLGNYLELFELMQQFLPAYKSEAPKLYRLLLFNYLFSNGDAHLKNFSIIETPMGDYRLSPAYDLLNSRIHIMDNDFALEEGLLPPRFAQGKIRQQFQLLAKKAGITDKLSDNILASVTANSEMVESLIFASYLNDTTKRNYLQTYQAKLKRLTK